MKNTSTYKFNKVSNLVYVNVTKTKRPALISYHTKRSFSLFRRPQNFAEINSTNLTNILVKPRNTKRKRDRPLQNHKVVH